MGQEIDQSHFKQRHFHSFGQRLMHETLLLKEQLEQGIFPPCSHHAGFELESWLVDTHRRPAPVNALLIAQLNNPLVVPELASFNIELNGPPQPLRGKGLSLLHQDLTRTWRACQRGAHHLGADMAMIGILPTATQNDLGLSNMSDEHRYHALNEEFLRLRNGQPTHLRIQGIEPLEMKYEGVMLESMATSFQIHIQISPEQAARYYNAAQIITAPLVALAANSPFLFGRDLWDETRIPLFEQALDVSSLGGPPRVTFGWEYARDSLFSLFEQNQRAFPVMLPIALEDPSALLPHLRLHNGTIWRWNRPLIGFDHQNTPHLRIEHRALSAGPTLVDCIANAAFFFGLINELVSSSEPPESKLNFEAARSNFYQAARLGMKANIKWLDGRMHRVQDLVLKRLLPQARQGLERLDIDAADIDDYLDVIEGRVSTGRNGAAWQRGWIAKQGPRFFALVDAYLERQQSEQPVHEWKH